MRRSPKPGPQPWHGPLHQAYRFRYRDDREYRLHSAATGLLYRQLLDRHVLDWLSDYPALWAPLLYVLAGQYEHAGVLGELVVQADRTSVAQELGGDPARAMAAPKHALQRKLLDGLRYLLKEQLKLNQPEASDGWLTEDGLWLVSKTVSDKLRARTPPVSGDRWHSCEQHRRVQRAARPRHAPAHLGRQSGLAHDRDQHDRLAPFVHPVASRSRADLGVRRATSTFRGHGRVRRDARGKRRQHVGYRAYRLGEPSAGRSRASYLGGRQHHHRFTARSPARARRHGGFCSRWWAWVSRPALARMPRSSSTPPRQQQPRRPFHRLHLHPRLRLGHRQRSHPGNSSWFG